MKLRNYQDGAIEGVFEEWKTQQSTLIVLPTGTGKTVVFCEIVKRSLPRRSLILAHRGELIYQAVNKLKNFGIDAEIEMADYRASSSLWDRSPVVVASVQTLMNEDRMGRFRPADFHRVIVDEGHHATAASYTKILDYFKTNPDIRILGVTATPDRADEKALGQVFTSVAYDYEILDAIQDGWLVPITQQMVTVDGLDFSAVRTTAGDLNNGDLSAILEAEENLHGIASSTLDIIGNKKTIVFTASVKQAEMLSDIFNRHRSEMSDWVCGATPKEKRKEKLVGFSHGSTQIMVNCGVLGEGFDCPEVEVVIQARPTKSRCLYSQQVGRATRPLAGVVDGPPTALERRAAIANSAKPSCLVVDFVGNSGRHKLMTTADILGGKFNDEEIELAEKRAKEKGAAVDMTEELERARQEIEERKRREAAKKAKVVGKASYRIANINPFDTLDIQPERARGWDDGRRLSAKQNELLLKQGVDASQLPYGQAKQLLNEMFRRFNGKLCTLKQANLLKKHGVATKDLSMKRASEMITAMANNNWRLPPEMKNPALENIPV